MIFTHGQRSHPAARGQCVFCLVGLLLNSGQAHPPPNGPGARLLTGGFPERTYGMITGLEVGGRLEGNTHALPGSSQVGEPERPRERWPPDKKPRWGFCLPATLVAGNRCHTRGVPSLGEYDDGLIFLLISTAVWTSPPAPCSVTFVCRGERREPNRRANALFRTQLTRWHYWTRIPPRNDSDPQVRPHHGVRSQVRPEPRARPPPAAEISSLLRTNGGRPSLFHLQAGALLYKTQHSLGAEQLTTLTPPVTSPHRYLHRLWASQSAQRGRVGNHFFRWRAARRAPAPARMCGTQWCRR